MSRSSTYRIKCQVCPAAVTASMEHMHVFIDCKRYVEAMAIQQHWLVEDGKVRCMVHKATP